MRLEGTYTALVTPFRADGALDVAALDSLVEWQIEAGIDGLVPCGSTGESATLSPAEHVQVIQRVTSAVRGRVAVVAGTGSNSTREAIEFTTAAREAGADAALLISPYYNKPTQEGIFRHYQQVALESGLPIVLYNIPSRTASRIAPETLARLSQVSGVVALKEAGGDLDAAAETIRLSNPDFDVLSGDDSLTLPLLALGGRGVISTTANVAPRQMAEITRAFREGDVERARETHYRLLPLMHALFCEPNPIPVKTALFRLGRIPDPALRLPLTPLEKRHQDRLESALEGIEGA
ncbi:MAG: 4-hydroxy-tetrahydrodipicolinate synthase [Myxococcota bacterium]